MKRLLQPGSLASIMAGLWWMEALASGQMLSGGPPFVPNSASQSQNYMFSPAAPSFVISRKLEFKLPWNGVQHTYLFGPELHVALGKRFTLNLWAQGGQVKRFALMEPLTQPIDATPPRYGFFTTPMNQTTFNGANQWAGSVGASIDYKISNRLMYRVVQTEYLLMSVKGSLKTDPRISIGPRITTGLRFSFGK